jgi:uncharacterized repeat protein (TIGR03803 family)
MRNDFRLRRKMVCCSYVILATAVTAAPAMADYTLKTLVNFNGTNGSIPFGGLIADASGNLYGTTYDGGTNGDGTVFEIPTGTSNLITLASFNDANGSHPFNGVAIDSSGNLYGSTSTGGALGDGAVYEIPGGSNTINLLASFTGENGKTPFGNVVVDTSGNVFGTTEVGPTIGGTVFEVAKGSGIVTTLHSDTSEIFAGLRSDSSGNLYGGTLGGGSDSGGTVFEIPSGTTNLVTVASFTGVASGVGPWSTPVFDSSGNLYGTTFSGDPASRRAGGTVYEIVKGSSTPIALGEFALPNGLVPRGDLAIDAAGDIFGTTEAGGPYNNPGVNVVARGYGTVFEIPAGTNTVTTLLSFNATDGFGPEGGIYLDASGNLFGTTSEGGTNNDGTLFELSPTVPEPGSLAILAAVGSLLMRRHNLRRQAGV